MQSNNSPLHQVLKEYTNITIPHFSPDQSSYATHTFYSNLSKISAWFVTKGDSYMPCKATALSPSRVCYWLRILTHSWWLANHNSLQLQKRSINHLMTCRMFAEAMLLINLDAHVLMPTRQMLAKNLTSISVMSAQLTSPSQTLKLPFLCTLRQTITPRWRTHQPCPRRSRSRCLWTSNTIFERLVGWIPFVFHMSKSLNFYAFFQSH